MISWFCWIVSVHESERERERGGQAARMGGGSILEEEVGGRVYASDRSRQSLGQTISESKSYSLIVCFFFNVFI